MRNIYSIAFIGALALTGAACSDDKSSSGGVATANSVSPAEGFAGRQIRVQISGDNTTWTSAATVSFGDGITVGTITVASPTDIFANITIAPTAALGMRDVKVTEGGVDATLTQSFEVTSPVTVSFQGTIAQGSIALYTLTNHDFDNPFDTTSTGDGFFSPLVYTNLAVTGPAGATLSVSNVAPYSASGTVLLDTDAAAGALSVASGPTGGTIVNSPADTLPVAPRTAMPVTIGTPVNVTVAKAFDSQLFAIDAKAAVATLAQIKTSTTNPDASPTVFLLDSTGKWANEITSGANINELITADTKYFAVAIDTSGTKGFQFAVNATTATLTKVNEVEPNNNLGQAQAFAALPGLFTTAAGAATLADINDVDTLKVVIPAGGNKKIHVTTLAGDTHADTVVEILKADGTTSIVMSDDQVYLDDAITATAQVPGTYIVKITASSMFDDTQNHYQALITLE